MTTQTISVQPKNHYTVAEFMALSGTDERYELLEGELIEMPGPNVAHGRIISRLFHHLDIFLTANLNPMGEVLNNLAFELSSENALLPDLAFVQTECLIGIDEAKAFPGAPDLAIEVMSPSDKWSEVSKKVRLYLQAGSKMIWVIDPFDEAVNVYRSDQPRRLLLSESALNGDDVIPGFTLIVHELFN